MLNGIYENPTTIIFGKDTENSVGQECAKYSTKVLLHYGGKGFGSNDLNQRITKSLANNKINFIELGGVKANPKADLIYQGIELCRKHDIGLILAIGGGSVIDSAKAIAIGVPYKGDFFDFFNKKASPREMLPLGVVLTISGTGSESSNAAVISKDGKVFDCSSPVMYPGFSILNPSLTVSVPPFLAACGVVDSISHVFERYFSNTPYVYTSDLLCEALIKTLMKNGAMLIEQPDNYDVRAELMWASKLAHDNTVGFGRQQDWATHTIAHQIGAHAEKPHGSIIAVLFPAWMKYVSKKNESKFIEFSERVIGLKDDCSPPSKLIEQAINQFRKFLQKMGMPMTLADLGHFSESDFDDVADQCSLINPSGTIGNYCRLDKQDIVEILKLCH